MYAEYSLALITGFALTRYLTEKTSFHIRFSGLWVHHWILAGIAMTILFFTKIDNPEIWGCLTGVSLEGLRRNNWSILDKK